MYIILSVSLGESLIISRQMVLEMMAAGFEPSESLVVDKHLDISLSAPKRTHNTTELPFSLQA